MLVNLMEPYGSEVNICFRYLQVIYKVVVGGFTSSNIWIYYPVSGLEFSWFLAFIIFGMGIIFGRGMGRGIIVSILSLCLKHNYKQRYANKITHR